MLNKYIKTRFDLIMFIFALFICTIIFIVKILPENFNIRVFDQHAKQKPHKIFYNDNYKKVDFYTTTYLRLAWFIPEVLPLFNSSVIGGYYNAALISTNFAVEGMKYLTHKKRPDGTDYKSFPSGHTAGTAVLAGFVHRFFGFKKAIVFYIGATIIGYSRVYCQKHDLYDVLAGGVIGFLMGYFINSFGKYLLEKMISQFKIIKNLSQYLSKELKL